MDEQRPAAVARSRERRKTYFCDQHVGNRIVAKIIPVLLVGAAGFATWVYIAQICVNFLIVKHRNTGLGVGLLAGYVTLFLFMSSSFFRIVFADPGYIPRAKDDPEKSATAAPNPTASAEMFVCEPGGYPRWCRTCEIAKPDRAHHSRDAQRCVYKMDHFCPWVGGMVGFTRYKFFLQFITYTAIFCTYTVASVAPLMARRAREDSGAPATWIIALALAGFFAIFMIPFSITHIYYTFKNITTNESFDHKTRTYLFNVLVTSNNHERSASDTSQRSVASQNPSSSARVVVTTDPHDPHPWDLGWRRNWKQTMGDKVWDWFLPIRSSPGDGVRFEYNENLVKKMRARARKVIRSQSARTGSDVASRGSRNLPTREMEEKDVSTLAGSGSRG